MSVTKLEQLKNRPHLPAAPQIAIITTGKEPVVSTLEIARHILPGSRQKTPGAVNKSIVKLIKAKLDGFNYLGQVNFESHPVYQGGLTEYALLNEAQTNLLFMAMSNKNQVVWTFKISLAKRFDQMKKHLLQRKNDEWLAYRNTGKIVTKQLNKLFDHALTVSGKNHANYRFINLQRAIYKAALNKTTHQLRQERNIPKTAIIRNYLNEQELQLVSAIQTMAVHSLWQLESVTDKQVLAAVANAGNALKITANMLSLAA